MELQSSERRHRTLISHVSQTVTDRQATDRQTGTSTRVADMKDRQTDRDKSRNHPHLEHYLSETYCATRPPLVPCLLCHLLISFPSLVAFVYPKSHNCQYATDVGRCCACVVVLTPLGGYILHCVWTNR